MRGTVWLLVACLLGCGSRSSLETPEQTKPETPPTCPATDAGEVVLVRDLPFRPEGLAVVGDWVYFGGSTGRGPVTQLPVGGLFRVPRTGGPYERVTSDYAGGTIVSDGRFLYYPKVVWLIGPGWSEYTLIPSYPNVVARPLDGGAPFDIPNPAPAVQVGLLRVNGRPGVYWLSLLADKTHSIDHWNTEDSTAVVRVQSWWHSLASFGVSNDELYRLSPEGTLITTNLDGTHPTTSKHGFDMILQVVDGTIYAARQGRLVRLSDDRELETSIYVTTNLRDPLLSLAVTGGRDVVYYSWSGGYTIARAAISACTDLPSADCTRRDVLFGQASEVKGIVLSGCDVFWTTAHPPAVLTRPVR